MNWWRDYVELLNWWSTTIGPLWAIGAADGSEAVKQACAAENSAITTWRRARP